jgi:hypothetical protein
MDARWQKSSYSGAAGQCLEARWQKSSHSGDANCLEASWQKSSYSADGHANCLEARQDGQVQVRDSKDPDGPVLKFSPGAWIEMLDWVKAMIPDQERWVAHG